VSRTLCGLDAANGGAQAGSYSSAAGRAHAGPVRGSTVSQQRTVQRRAVLQTDRNRRPRDAQIPKEPVEHLDGWLVGGHRRVPIRLNRRLRLAWRRKDRDALGEERLKRLADLKRRSQPVNPTVR
jgi:hypothetical protein